MKYFIYILYSEKSDIFYVGYTSNIDYRFSQHNETSLDSFTSKHRPWKIMALFLVGEVEAGAIRLERFIKKQKSIPFIKKLVDPDFIPTGAIAQLVRVPHLRD